MDEREKLSGKIASLQQWQWMCFLPGIVLMISPHGQAIDATHARNAALFRLFVSLGGFLLFVVLQIVKANWKKRLAALEQSSIANGKPPIPPPF